jgi:hypothetical protein
VAARKRGETTDAENSEQDQRSAAASTTAGRRGGGCGDGTVHDGKRTFISERLERGGLARRGNGNGDRL